MKASQVVVIGSIGIVKNNYVGTDTSRIFLGGTGFTIAHTLSRLNGQRVKLISAIGEGDFNFIEQLNASNVDTTGVSVFTGVPTASGEVNTYSNGRQEWIRFGDQVTKLIKPTIEPGILTILSPIHKKAFRVFQSLLIASNAPYIYDPGMLLHDLDDVTLKEGILHSKFVISNSNEWKVLTERLGISMQELATMGITPIITRGAEGVEIFTGEIVIDIPSVKAQLTDPTGAGDVWRAGFTHKILSDSTVTEAAKFANVLASIGVEYTGAIDFPLDFNEIQRRLDLIEKPYELR